MAEAVRQGENQFPFREKEYRLLKKLLNGFCPLVPLHVFGHNATGKTSVVKAVVRDLGLTHAFVNCVEFCFSMQMIFEEILIQLDEALDGNFDAPRCRNENEFVLQLKRLLGNEEESDKIRKRTVCIVFDNAERLRRLPPTVLATICRLKELTGFNIAVILISCLPWTKFYVNPTGLPPTLRVYFESYSRNQLAILLQREAPPGDVCSQEVYASFIAQLLNVLHGSCTNLQELRYIAKQNFRAYMEPVWSGEMEISETVRLGRNIIEHLSSSLQNVYLRENCEPAVSNEMTPARLPLQTGASALTPSWRSKLIAKKPKLGREVVELPYQTKYLLIAGYLASYCPKRLDRRLFMKSHGKVKVSKRLHKKTARSELVQAPAPKAFELDRLMAIFYAIFEDDVQPWSADFNVQIASLVSVGLLSQVGKPENLTILKYKCSANLDLIRSLALNVGFKLDDYLKEIDK